MPVVRRFLWLILLTAVIATAAAAVWFRGARPLSEVDPLPPVAASVFRNTQPQAAFVGAAACRECHPDQHQSWTQTAHSLALADIDPAREPPPGKFVHRPSGRSYEVLVEGNAVRHRETARTSALAELLLAELPMKYVIGSGRFSRSYLASRDGFLVESPITWYAALGEWRISPGYDTHNPGFERPINRECIGCHAGRAEPERGAVQRFTIHVQSIDCERCHGPGSLHVEFRRRQSAVSAASEPDFTIANPARMSRAEREDVCAQCHLHSAATVDLRGRRRTDYRPGLKLSDFCVHYALETPQRQMSVVGHVEQLRLSACYRKSDSLTCTTCHDPHQPVPPADAVAFFRGKCLDCHTESACSVPRETRLAAHADDNCMACHMPTSKTDIPHFAFTHHRIGIHKPGDDAAPDQNSLLLPLEDVSQLSQIERDRCAGLAYLQAAGMQDSPSTTGFQQRALDLLEDVRERGLSDPEVDAALTRLLWGVDQERTMELAEAVLDRSDASPESRVTALFTLATSLLDRKDHARAVPLLEELITLRLASEDWFLLSTCREELGDIAGAATAAQRAAEIAPQYSQLQERLAQLFNLEGRADDAAAARSRAALLESSSLVLPQPPKQRP